MAIQSFENQTYPRRELLILADGDDVADLAAGHKCVQLVHLAEARQIGAKRNYGCGRARGEIICHWDDDDFSDPTRLTEQVGKLVDDPKLMVTGFHSMRFTDGKNWWEYCGTPNYALGTSLCYRRAWWVDHPFRAVQVGEDNEFVAEAWAAGVLHTEDSSGLMYATVHPHNTSPRSMGSAFKPVNV